MSSVGDSLLGLWHYWACFTLMMVGLHTLIARRHLVKKLMGLNIFQVSVILFYVSIAKVRGGTAPIFPSDGSEEVLYSNPLPHVLMLTAIVVGVATTALGLALVVRIQEAFGTVEENEILQLQDADLRSEEPELGPEGEQSPEEASDANSDQGTGTEMSLGSAERSADPS